MARWPTCCRAATACSRRGSTSGCIWPRRPAITSERRAPGSSEGKRSGRREPQGSWGDPVIDLNPQAAQMADESMVRTLAAQAQAIWPQEAPLLLRYRLPQEPAVLDAGCGTGEGA